MRLPIHALLLLSSSLLFAPSALAQDDTDDPFADEEEAPEGEKPDRLDEGDEIEFEDDPEEMDEIDIEGEEGDDLLGEEIGEDQIGGEGQDNATIYRQYQTQVADEAPDEEMILWERYLDRYPNSLFRDRIEQRMEDLEADMYQERIETGGDERLDADQREILFAQGLQLESLNPRSRMQAGFEWGLPDYINLFADYEHQILRNLSVHGGLRHRYTGWRVETGVHWAFVKASRTKTIVALLGDVHFNTNPAYPVLRPQLGAGKSFGKLDAQLQLGAEVDTRADAGLRGVGGANLTYKAAESVALFGETSLYMQQLSSEKGPYFFRFNVMSFGLKFYPELENGRPGQLEINLGASVPYTSNFWKFHYGSIMGQVNYYL